MTDTFLQYQVLQLCQNTIQTCPFSDAVAGADCTRKFCTGYPAYIGVATCPQLNEDPDNCCGSNDPQTCLANYAHSGTGTGSGSTPNVCASVISILDGCFSATPALSPPPSSMVSTSGPSATALASCACYDSDGTFDPSAFDGYASQCAASGSAAHPTYYPLVTPLQNFCTNNGGSGTPMTAAGTTTEAAGSTPMPAGTTASPATPTSSSGTAQTTTGKSGGAKITLKGSAILLLGCSVLMSLF